MRKIYKRLIPLIAFFALLAPFSARATHVMGADIEWQCLGNDSFEIIAHAYRDCNGIQLSGTGLAYYSPGDTCVPSSVSANPSVCCGTDITPVCNRSCDRCISNPSCVFPYGIEEFTITATLYLDPNCCNWTFSWQESARNSLITTGAANQNFYIEVHANICQTPCASSPYFTNPPVAIFCVNQCEVYNPGVDDDSRDAEGRADSLSYSFGVPLSAQGTPIPYIAPYTNDAPLIFAGPSKDAAFIPPYCYGFHLDSTTGDLEFKATKTDITVLNIVVTIWRRDSLGVEQVIGNVQRGLELIIIDCPNDIPPVIPGINGGTSYSEQICADQQTCFDVKSFDLDPNDTVTLKWNDPGTMNGASFTVIPNGLKWPTAVFCWYPTDADVRSYPYTFIATATDNACPIPGSASKAFSVYVIAAPSALYSATVEKCGKVYFQAQPASNSSTSITEYLWVGQGTPGYGPLYIPGRTGTYQYNKGGTYYYSLVVTGPNGCTRTYEDSVIIANFPGIRLPRDTEVCDNSPTITVTATPVSAFQPYQIWWNFKGANGDSLTSGSITEKITHDTAFRVNILDPSGPNGCPNYDSMKVTVIPLPKPNLGPDQRGCWGHPVMLSTGLPHEPVVKWTQIVGKDTIKNQLHGDTVFVSDSGMYVVYVQDSIGCGGTDTINVYFNPLVSANKVDSTVCLGDSVKLRAGIGGSGASYKWIDQEHNNRVLSNAPTYGFLAVASQGYGLDANFEIVISQSQHGITCSDTGYYSITVNTPTKPNLNAPPPQCISNPAYPLAVGPPLVDPAHEGGNWSYPRNPSAVVNNFLYPSVMGRTDNNPALGFIHYTYYNAYKCVTDDSIRVVVSLLPEVSAGPDTTICTGNGKYLLSNLSVTPTGGYWYVLNGTPPAALTYSSNRDSVFFNPNTTGVSDTVYGIIYSYTAPPSSGTSSCSNNDTVYIRVRTNPAVTVIPLDSLCQNATPVQMSQYANPQGGFWEVSDAADSSALTHGTYGSDFIASKASSGWHYLKYTLYGDPIRDLCPTVKIDSVYVVPAPLNPDFHTSDNQWEYCVNHGDVTLVPTINGKTTTEGSFNATVIGDEVIYAGKNIYNFYPSRADTTNSANNTILYTLPYNGGQCFVTATHVIKVDGRPGVKITTGSNVCAGTNSFNISATVSNTTSLTWSSGGSNQGFTPKNADSTEVSYTPTSAQQLAGSFTVTATASNQGDCTPATATTTFHINQLPVIDFSSNQAGCEPYAVHFTPTVSVGGVTNSSLVKSYLWNFGDGSAPSQDVSPYHIYNVTNGKDTQQYNVTLTVTSDSGCVSDTEKAGWITVYATPKPIIDANPQFTTIALPQVQFAIDPKSSGIDYTDPATTYTWTFGDSSHTVSNLENPTYTYGDTGTFKVKVEVSSKGCIGDTFIDVYVQPELIIYIPNVFKPDNHHGDGISTTHEPNYFSAEVNNTFQPVISSYQSFQMSVYNRWGQLMYTTYDPTKGWNGWFEGHEPVGDVYVYVIKATGYSGKAYTFTGTVTLLY